MGMEKLLAVALVVLTGRLVLDPAIAALVGGTVYVVFDQAARTHQLAVDRCHDAGGAWVASGERSYTGQCLRTPNTPPWPPAKP